MKIIISEKQYRTLVEQNPVQKKDDWWNRPSYDRREWEKSTKTLENIGNLNPHTLATILQIGTAFIPVVGPFISAGIGLAEAALYYKEGDNQTAGLVAGFSMLPFAGSIVSKIPGIKQLGSKGMAMLASKISKGGNLSKAELEIAEAIKSFSSKCQEELSKMAPKLKNIVKELDTYKPNFIKKYGEQEYNKLLASFLYDGIDKKTFIGKLKGVKDLNIKIKPVLGGGADHRVFQSLTNPNIIFKAELRPGEITKWYETFRKYPKVFAKVYRKTKVKGDEGTLLDAVPMEKLNTKGFMSFWDDLEKNWVSMQKSLSPSEQLRDLEYLVKHIKEPSYSKKWNQFVNYIKKQNPSISSKVDEFVNIVNELYKIVPNPDIRKFNLGYDINGFLKVFDL